jgi:CheY-like chemotaxis protein
MKKILILDDEPELLEIWLHFFKDWDLLVEVHTATNGAEGLKMIDAVGEYDLIITDFKMPVMNGLEFIHTLRTQQANTRTPIFFFTGYMPELKNHMDILENVMLFEKPAISQKMKTHIAASLKEISIGQSQNAVTK